MTPHISPDERERVFKTLEFPMMAEPGTLNFVITKAIQAYLSQKPQVRYADYNEVIGVLECAKMELYRLVISKYEDLKIKQHGSAYP